MARKLTISLLLASLASFNVTAQEVDCSKFLTNPIFTKTTTEVSTASKDRFRLLQCASSFKSYADTRKYGIDVTVPVYGVPVEFGGDFENATVEQWKSQNCSSEDRKSDQSLAYFQSVTTIDPISAKAALECVKSRTEVDIASRSALRCRVTDTPAALIFEAEWARTPGEAGNPPIVETFGLAGTNCKGAPGPFGVGQSVPEGGVAMLCDKPERSAAFSLNTNRGSCVRASETRYPRVTLASMSLSAPLFIAGTDVEIPAGWKLVTNGYPVTIRADRLQIAGSASITSFDAREMKPNEQGRFAGSILISAKELLGQGLSILNAGEPGGIGPDGPGGPPGSAGGPGKGRSPLQGKCGWLSFACDNLPITCTGGENGGTGGTGGPGSNGSIGAPGGGGGLVTLEVPLTLTPSIQVLTDVGTDGKPQSCGGKICGGIGGRGGKGGPGGPGGPGGAAGPRTLTCGGTNPGGTGPVGPVGADGDKGPDGYTAEVRTL